MGLSSTLPLPNSAKTAMTINAHTPIDTPFHFRYTCWFCGEPSYELLKFPNTTKPSQYLEHAFLAIPSCKECDSFKYPSELRSIWELRAHIKQALISKYTKHLGIGENWTEDELADSDFSGSILGGFGRSAWTMYKIAKQRVNHQGWPISIDSLPIDSIDDTGCFEFDGTRYLSLNACIQYFVDATGIDKELLVQLVDLLSPNQLEYAIKIAKLNKGLSSSKRTQIISEISLQLAEERQADAESVLKDTETQPLVDVYVSGAVAPIFAIQWAIKNGISSLDNLCDVEDDYFDEFEHLGGAAAFTSYNGLQLYLQAREEQSWIDASDPNKARWLSSPSDL
jgi:hypothetical protein